MYPGPEVGHVLYDVPPFDFWKKPIVGAEDDSSVLIRKVQNPFREPGWEKT